MDHFDHLIQAYLVKHQYGNAQHEDLWEALTQV